MNKYKHSLEVSIAKWGEEDTCKNCLYYHDLFCDKFKASVNEDASCTSFEWSEEELIF